MSVWLENLRPHDSETPTLNHNIPTHILLLDISLQCKQPCSKKKTEKDDTGLSLRLNDHHGVGLCCWWWYAALWQECVPKCQFMSACTIHKIVGVFSLQNWSTHWMKINETFRWELVADDFPYVVLHTKSIISFYLWCTLGGSVWIWMKSNLLRFIGGQPHFSTSWHGRMSLTLNEPI
jgi:hypothetical protein